MDRRSFRDLRWQNKPIKVFYVTRPFLGVFYVQRTHQRSSFGRNSSRGLWWTVGVFCGQKKKTLSVLLNIENLL